MSVGMTYEGKPDGWDHADFCTVHGGYEMFHTCAGGPGEPLGYCSKASDATSCRWPDTPSEEG